MTRARKNIALLLLVAALAMIVWRSYDASEPASNPSELAESEPTVSLVRPPGLAVTPYEAAEVSAPPGQSLGDRWWYVGTVQSIRPEVTKARVIAHWWPRHAMATEPPARVFRSEELDLSQGPASFRLAGEDGGFVILFLESEGRLQLFRPWASPQGDAMQPGRGLGVGAGYVGTYAFRGRAVDKDGTRVPGARMLVRDAGADLLQAVTTEHDGRFALDGFRTTSIEVTVQAHGGYGVMAEFSGFRDKPFELGDDDVEVHIPRNPIVVPHLGASVGGSFYPAAARSFATTKIMPDGREQMWSTFDLYQREQKLRLTPGRWRLHHRLDGAESPPVETGELQLDQVVHITFDTTFKEETILVGVEVDNPFGRSERTPRCTVGAKHASRGGGWGGPVGSLEGNRCLLGLFAPGRSAVAGAVAQGGEVWVAAPVEIDVASGDRVEVRLPVQRAGGLRVIDSRGPRVTDIALRVRDPMVPERCMYEEGTLRMKWLSSQRNDGDGIIGYDTTWWMQPGRYTLQRLPRKGEPIEEHELLVEAGRVTLFEETDDGLRRLP